MTDEVNLDEEGLPAARNLRFEERNPFQIEQYANSRYANRARQMVCRKCGGERFHIAHADYFTAVRCIYCKTEVCVHEG